MLLIAACTLCALWTLGVLVVVGLCRSAASADAEAVLAPGPGTAQPSASRLRLIA
jgi:hypothetical protein